MYCIVVGLLCVFVRLRLMCIWSAEVGSFKVSLVDFHAGDVDEVQVNNRWGHSLVRLFVYEWLYT